MSFVYLLYLMNLLMAKRFICNSVCEMFPNCHLISDIKKNVANKSKAIFIPVGERAGWYPSRPLLSF